MTDIFLRTKMATDWPEKEPLLWKIVKLLLWFLLSNPGYEKKMHLVHEWAIEFDEDGQPWREIALDNLGNPVFAGPSKENYGFWLDTNMAIEDFEGEKMSPEEFERLWCLSGVKEFT